MTLLPHFPVFKLPEPCLVVLMGASGAGKSTEAARIAAVAGADTIAISYDQCRELLTGDATDQSATAAAVEFAHHRIRLRSAAGMTTVVDGTHTTIEQRQPLLDLAAALDLPAVLVVLATPLETCLARQQTREPRQPGAAWGRRVPDNVVRTQHAAVLASLPHLHTEGWHSLHVRNIQHSPGKAG